MRQSSSGSAATFLRRLARDRAGNTLALIAAAIAPLMAMVGGGVDMGRSYLSQSRLQQACDAGVLAARKRLGSEAAVTGEIPETVAETGQRFFNINFRDGSYGTKDRDFTMTLESDYAISGVATVDVPTTIMRVFGFEQVPVRVECEAQINFSNTDVMMVLDVTGSMNTVNSGDSVSRISALKSTVQNFYDQLQAAAQAGTRIRYGFVPYSTNVNVGGLLDDDWVVDKWTYQSRRLVTVLDAGTDSYTGPSTYRSGTATDAKQYEYAASYTEKLGYYCPAKPEDSVTSNVVYVSSRVQPAPLPAVGLQTVDTYERTRNGYSYKATPSGPTCTVTKTTYTNYVDRFDVVNTASAGVTTKYQYKPLSMDVSDWRTSSNGCMEERSTYEIGDYNNVDLSRALDLDIDRVPTAGDADTQWRPMFPSIIYARAMEWSGAGSWSTAPVTTSKNFIDPFSLGTTACPPPARKLAEMTRDELDSYLATLKANGSTYHDIGMIWGARLISPTGLFAEENANTADTSPTNRNIIFLTDGQTAPMDFSYSSYGLEPLDKRRWSTSSTLSLTKTVEKRFNFVCDAVRKKNVTIWLIGFGTSLSDTMKNCAGEGHYFTAANAAELNATFAGIAKKMSELRIER